MKFMKKALLLSLVLVFLFSMTSTAASYSFLEEALQGEDTVSMTIAHPEPEDPQNYVHAAALAFKDHVETRSNNQIQVEISPGGALGDSAELPQQVQMGVVEGAMSIAEGHIAPYFNKINVIGIPYLFRSVDHALETLSLDNEFGKNLFGDFEEETGLKVLTIWDNGGFRNFTNNVREIRTPEDMEGLAIRTMDIPAHMELVESLGANPTPVAWTELYNALQMGVVDGQENAIPTVDMGRIQEVQDYMILDEHLFSMHIFPINASWYDGLPEVYQMIIDNGAEVAQKVATRQNRILRETLLDNFIEEGMQVYDPTPEELELFREATQEPVTAYIRDEVGDELVDDLLEAAEKAAEKLGY